MIWSSARFGDLSVDHLYDALALRAQVFILEQGPYLDPDGLDRQSWHLLGRDDGGVLQAYLRVVDPGLKFDEPSIGRVVTSASARGTGLGRELMAQGLRLCQRVWPGRALRISAQTQLQRFYGEFGFAPVGSEYLEDDIPHIQMQRSADDHARHP